jgi:hypothetical protein
VSSENETCATILVLLFDIVVGAGIVRGGGVVADANTMLTTFATVTAFSALVRYPFVPSKTVSTVNVPPFGIIGRYSVSVTAA